MNWLKALLGIMTVLSQAFVSGQNEPSNMLSLSCTGDNGASEQSSPSQSLVMLPSFSSADSIHSFSVGSLHSAPDLSFSYSRKSDSADADGQHSVSDLSFSFSTTSSSTLSFFHSLSSSSLVNERQDDNQSVSVNANFTLHLTLSVSGETVSTFTTWKQLIFRRALSTLLFVSLDHVVIASLADSTTRAKLGVRSLAVTELSMLTDITFDGDRDVEVASASITTLFDSGSLTQFLASQGLTLNITLHDITLKTGGEEGTGSSGSSSHPGGDDETGAIVSDDDVLEIEKAHNTSAKMMAGVIVGVFAGLAAVVIVVRVKRPPALQFLFSRVMPG